MTAVATGTATGYDDLYDRFLDFATAGTDLVAAGEEWALDRDSGGEAILHGPGLAAADAIYVGVRQEADPTNDRYGLQLMGCTGYLSGSGWAAQPGSCPVGTTDGQRVYLWDSEIPYWLIGSGRRLIVVAKVSTVYQIAYLGLALPYATPGQYPYPLVVGGCGQIQAQRWSATGDGHRALFHPHSTLTMRMPDGSWPAATDAGTFRLAPNRAEAPWATLRECADGTTRPLHAQILATSSPAKNVLGELDGVFFCPGFGAGAEDTVSIGGTDYLLVPDAYRSGTADYAAVRLD